jgi:ATP synthase protein I
VAGEAGGGAGGSPNVGAGWTAITILLGGLLAWGGIGYLLDRLFGFRALFLPIGLIVGAIGGTWLVIIRYARDQND